MAMFLDVGDIVKNHKKDQPLDPDVDWHNSGKRRVAWSDRRCWTTLQASLWENGVEGWELVGTTPVLEQYTEWGWGNPVTDVVTNVFHPSFQLLFKRQLALPPGI